MACDVNDTLARFVVASAGAASESVRSAVAEFEVTPAAFGVVYDAPGWLDLSNSITYAVDGVRPVNE